VQSSDILSPAAVREDTPPSRQADLSRPSSSASFNKGGANTGETGEGLPRASSVETDLVFGTLPKKKKKRWHGIKKIGSPLFRNRRKSFTHGHNHTPSSIAHKSISSTYTPSVATTTEVEDKDHRQSIISAVSQASAGKPTTENRAESRSEEGVSSSKVLMSPVKVVDLVERKLGTEKIREKAFRKRSMATPSRKGRGRDECLKALKVMTTLSSNKESIGTLVSYICLPKCVSK